MRSAYSSIRFFCHFPFWPKCDGKTRANEWMEWPDEKPVGIFSFDETIHEHGMEFRLAVVDTNAKWYSKQTRRTAKIQKQEKKNEQRALQFLNMHHAAAAFVFRCTLDLAFLMLWYWIAWGFDTNERERGVESLNCFELGFQILPFRWFVLEINWATDALVDREIS